MTSLTPDRIEDGPVEYDPCPLCKQYSHSIPEDKLAEAFRHFDMMVCGNPLKPWPTHHAFDEQTRDYAQVLVAAARKALTPVSKGDEM